jgi:hypothetical protein
MKALPTQAAPTDPQDGPGVKLPAGELELAEFDATAAGKKLALLSADAELLYQLMLGKYAGRDWLAFADLLARYGLAVLTAWIEKDALVRMCLAKGIRAPRLLRHTRSEREDIARWIVTESIFVFRRDVLIPGRWNAAKGATLKTYFIGQCLLQYPNAYREWQQQHVPRPYDREELARQLGAEGQVPASPAQLAELNMRLPELVAAPRSPAALAALFAAGFSQEEIGANAGLTTQAVQSAIKRHRKAAA